MKLLMNLVTVFVLVLCSVMVCPRTAAAEVRSDLAVAISAG